MPAAPTSGSTVGALFDGVSALLQQAFFDAAFREQRLPTLVARFRQAAHAVTSVAEERVIVREFLSHIPSSHLGLLSRGAKSLLDDELFGRARPTVGMQLLEFDGRHFAAMVLDGGPAHRAGIRNWDEVLAIDGDPVDGNPTLEARTDDAHLPVDRDPPMRAVRVEDGQQLILRIARRPESADDVEVTVTAFSALDAARRSVRRFDYDDARIGYIHFWYFHGIGVPETLAAAFDSGLAEVDCLVLDLRGRGGSSAVAPRLLRMLEEGVHQRFAGPTVALADRQTRSGKEVLLYELRARKLATIVGEPTAGAVVAADFADFGDDVLMYPTATVPKYTEQLELKSLRPDLAVAWGGPHSGDKDPILAAGIETARQLVRRLGKGRVIAAATRVAQSIELPSTVPALGEVMERMSIALGGIEALSRYCAMSASGSARILDTPFTGTFSVRVGEMDGYESIMELEGGIRIVQRAAARDDSAVSIEGGQRRELVGAAAMPLRWQSLVAPPIGFREAFPSARIDGSEAFAGRPAIRVVLGEDADQAVCLFVDAETWHPLGLRFRAPSPVGMLDVVRVYESYREVDGVRIPDVISTDAAGQVFEVRLEEIHLAPSAPVY
jgi:carboxyl-terminal processing protease